MSEDPYVFAKMWEGPQVLALAFSPDGTRLASGSKDTIVRLWNINNHESTVPSKTYRMDKCVSVFTEW